MADRKTNGICFAQQASWCEIQPGQDQSQGGACQKNLADFLPNHGWVLGFLFSGSEIEAVSREAAL